MKTVPQAVSSWLENKDFSPEETHGLIMDIHQYFEMEKQQSLQNLNRELESLGWGIHLVDRGTYEKLNTLRSPSVQHRRRS